MAVNQYKIHRFDFLPVVVVGLFVLHGCQHNNAAQDDVIRTYDFISTDTRLELPLSDEDVEFVREYTYRASEDDSKNSSRKKAIEQIRILLSEEIGVYLESYLEINKIDSSDVTREDVSHEIKSLSSGITRIRLLDEKWDGNTYYVKASVRTNPQQAIETLLEAIKAKSAKSEIDRLNLIIAKQKALLSESNDRATELQKELVRQELLYETRQSERLKNKTQLIRTAEEQMLQEKMLAVERVEIEKVKRIVRQSRDKRDRIAKKACLIEKGMTKFEVLEALGKPEYGYITNSRIYYYGEIVINFDSTTERVSYILGCGSLLF